MIGEDIILPLTIPTGDVHPLSQLLLPTIYTHPPERGPREYVRGFHLLPESNRSAKS